MRYMTPEELKKTSQKEVRSVLGAYTGKSVRESAALDVFLKYHKKFFTGRHEPILDLGAASGGFLKKLAENGFTSLYGLDIDHYLAEENKKIVREYKTADLSWDRLPWPDNTFQMVSAWCVLPHLENPFHAIREVGRTLRQGGGVHFFSAQP